MVGVRRWVVCGPPGNRAADGAEESIFERSTRGDFTLRPTEPRSRFGDLRFAPLRTTRATEIATLAPSKGLFMMASAIGVRRLKAWAVQAGDPTHSAPRWAGAGVFAALTVSATIAVAGTDSDRVTVAIEAQVEATLKRVRFSAQYRWTPANDAEALVLANVADRASAIPAPLPPAAEPQLFADGYDGGGFRELSITVAGQACRRVAIPPVDDIPLLGCAGRFRANAAVEVRVEGRLEVPDRYGAFGRHLGQLTLLGGWVPAVGRPDAPPPIGDVSARVLIPPGFAVVLGRTYAAHVPGRGARWVEAAGQGVTLPLIVLPARTGSRGVEGGAFRWISGRRYTDDETALRQAELTVGALADVVDFLRRSGLTLPQPDRPLLVVEAPLRRNLARAADGVVLVSDRAFRLFPLERFQRFHRYPVVREIMTTWALDHVRPDGDRHVAADAVGAFLRDRFVQDETGVAEDLFDVLWFWKFIPAIDSLLYAPQTAFIGAYFRLVNEQDPLRANLVDPPSSRPRGRIVYEKLLDRVGPVEAAATMNDVATGADLRGAFARVLGPTSNTFFDTWLGPYPAMQYALTAWQSEPTTGARCAPAEQCHLVTVDVQRTGAAVVEPVQLRLTDDAGDQRMIWTETSSQAIRTTTATLGASLDLVELDPRGRLSETPSVEVPSPKFDNRSRPKWRVLLNNFNFASSPTAGTINTSLNLGFSRVRDVRWRFGLVGGFSPEALSLAAIAQRRFGPAVTPDRLARWVSLVLSGGQLRSDFAGEMGDNVAVGARLTYGFDNRQTAWAPEAGTGFRASINYNHVFGDLSAQDPDGPRVTRDAVAVTVRGLRSWRVDGRHQLSLRGSVGAYVVGRPQSQLLYFLGGRSALRGYVIDEEVGRFRAIASGEWVHHLLGEANDNVLEMVWATALDGALYADVAIIGDDFDDPLGRRLRADVGYGLRVYLDFFGVRPGVMAVDLAWPLLNDRGRFEVGPPAVYIDFSQSFFFF